MADAGYVWDESKKELRKIEQNPDDNVEQKFHKGDFIIANESSHIYQVVDVKRGIYIIKDLTDDVEYHIGIEEAHKSGRLWTIKDAKVGDVLHSTGFHNDCIFIFNGLDNWKFDEPNGDRAVATGYCCLFVSADKMEFGMQGPDCIEVNTVKPATKIQRDLLFQKMHEAGYEWDADKKELKKIEQKPVWSKEDERLRKTTIAFLKDFAEQGYENAVECIDWLEKQVTK